MESSSNNIKEYYELVKHKYDIDLKEFTLICNNPFDFIKSTVNSGILKDFRYKYFGVFKVSYSRLCYYKKILQDKLNKGLIEKEKYEKKINILESYEEENK